MEGKFPGLTMFYKIIVIYRQIWFRYLWWISEDLRKEVGQ